MKEKKVKVAYSEPLDYFPEEIRKKYKLGEYAEEDSILKYRSYYVYDFEFEDIQVAEGEDHDAAQALYDKMTKDCVADAEEKWAFDIALDCVRNFTEADCANIREQGEIPFFHFGYGMTVRNKYVHPSKVHTYFMADDVSSTVEKFIYAILIEEENA
jgi:hypothetical protein